MANRRCSYDEGNKVSRAGHAALQVCGQLPTEDVRGKIEGGCEMVLIDMLL